jgi:tRNA threonylcarbamoyladenosine biosynthesis protein TsaB
MPDNKLVLGIDTSGVKCRIALWQEYDVLYEKTMTAPNLHSTLLAEGVNSGLSSINVKAAHVQLVCVTSGPGSFTGLRIGMSYAKGFCFAREIPLIGVTNFEVLAQQVKDITFPLYTLLDARRGFYYLGIFKKNVRILDEYKMVKAVDIQSEIAERGYIVCGEQDNGSELPLPVPLPVPVSQAGIKIGIVCRLGYQKYLAGAQTNPDNLEPLYIQPFAGIS